MRITLWGLLTRRSAGNPVVEVPANAFDEAVPARNEKQEARVKARADEFDKKLKGVRLKMNAKGQKVKQTNSLMTTARNWAIGLGLLLYGWLFLQFGPILLGCTLALVLVGGGIFLFLKFRPKDDPEEED